MIFLLLGYGTSYQVLLFISVEYSKSIACFQFLFSRASSRFCGSPVEVKQLYLTVPSVYTLGFWIPPYNLVLGLTSGMTTSERCVEDSET
jgi:hypothetical protein